ncbi:hypothetical protein CFE70_002764 [Pyrenophora teres f. teres 0-1]
MPATEVADDFAEEISAPESPPARPAKRLKLPWPPAVSAPIVAQPSVVLSPNKTDRNWPGTTTQEQPPKKPKLAIPGGLGFAGAPLYQYRSSNSGVPLIVSFLEKHLATTIDVPFLIDFQEQLFQINGSGSGLGPHLAILAVRPAEGPDESSARKSMQINPQFSLDLRPGYQTVGEYFGLPATSKRAIFEPKIESLIQSYMFGTKTIGHVGTSFDPSSDPELQVCGRCSDSNKKLAHETCSQAYRGDKLLNDGICNNCIFSGASQICSFRLVPRGVKASGASEGLSDSFIIPSSSSNAIATRKSSSIVIPSAIPRNDPSSFVWTSEKNANKFADHLIATRKGVEDHYEPSLPSSCSSLDASMSDGLSDDNDLDEDLTEEVRTPKRPRRRAKTPEPELSEELDHTVRRSSRLAGRPAVPPVVLAISSEDGSERDSEEDDSDDSDTESEDAFDSLPPREVDSDSGSEL